MTGTLSWPLKTCSTASPESSFVSGMPCTRQLRRLYCSIVSSSSRSALLSLSRSPTRRSSDSTVDEIVSSSRAQASYTFCLTASNTPSFIKPSASLAMKLSLDSSFVTTTWLTESTMDFTTSSSVPISSRIAARTSPSWNGLVAVSLALLLTSSDTLVS